MSSCGKGDKRRPCQIGKEERFLREAYMEGAITFKEFERRYRWLLHDGKITRGGRKIGR